MIIPMFQRLVFSYRASLVAQTEKNLPAVCETWVQSLGWEDPLEEGGHGNPLQYSYLENPHGQRSLAGSVHGVANSQTGLSD